MTWTLTTCLGAIAYVVLPPSAAWLGLACLRNQRLRVARAASEGQMERDLRVLQLRWTGTQVSALQLQVLLALGVALLALRPGGLGLSVATIAALAIERGPRRGLQAARASRSFRIEQQLDRFLLALSNALKSTPALGDALRTVQAATTAPLRDEIQLLLRELDLGEPLDRALSNLTERVRSPMVSAAVVTLRVARNTGGNLSLTLERAASSLRELARLEALVRSKTAEGRAQATVIAIVPIPLVLMLNGVDPTFLQPLRSTTTGHLLVAAACVLWIAAVALARRIVDVEV